MHKPPNSGERTEDGTVTASSEAVPDKEGRRVVKRLLPWITDHEHRSMTIRRVVIHPLALSICPILALWAGNADLVAFRDVSGSLFGAAFASAVVWLALNLRIKNARKSGLVVSLIILLIFYYPYLMLSLVPILMQTLRAIVHAEPDGALASSLVALVLCILAGVAIWVILRSKSELLVVTSFLNLVALSLLLLSVVQWFRGYSAARDAREFIAGWQAEVLPDTEVMATGSGLQPDVYYIIVDGYARADVLRELYEVDNSAFLSFLQARGFYIAAKSRANYSQTALSVASSLNFMYLDTMAGELGRESGNRLPLVAMIHDSRVVAHLRSHGYTIVAFATGYSPTEMRRADRFLAPPFSLNMFQAEVLSFTIIPQLYQLPFVPTPYDSHRNRILHTLDRLPDVTRIDGPAFVFAHIVAPHPPFVLGSEGEHLTPAWEQSLGRFTLADGPRLLSALDSQEYVESYGNQLLFISARLRNTIDRILSLSAEPPIIIIQADHGPGSTLDWDNPTAEGLHERMSILNAYYFPTQDYGALYEEISPVNTFRVVLNTYAGTDYPMLPDESYFSSWERPYSFTLVPSMP
jgi:hypothetical protein